MSKLKTREQYNVLTGDPYQNLALAIVINACKTYQAQWGKPAKSAYRQKVKIREAKQSRRFLLSPNCDLLLSGTRFTGKVLLEAMDKKHEEEIKNGRKFGNNIGSDKR